MRLAVVRRTLGWILLASIPTAVLAPTAVHAEERGWFVSFQQVFVPQDVKKSDVTRLVDAGSLTTDGFSELVFSFGGEFKEALPSGGKIGAILLPDVEIVDYLLRNEGQLAFPLEVTFDVAGLGSHVFISSQQTAKIGFPKYRVYFYNETSSGATVSLFVYRTRR